jgi:hypothetical protein
MIPPNPQFPKLLSPFQIRQVKLKNRMVKPSQAMRIADEGGYVSEANRGFYEALARGGVGLIVVEHTFPDYPMGINTSRPIAISEDKFIPGLASLADGIHRFETLERQSAAGLPDRRRQRAPGHPLGNRRWFRHGLFPLGQVP